MIVAWLMPYIHNDLRHDIDGNIDRACKAEVG